MLGFENITYYAYESDPMAIKIALSNYPDIIQMGDAFQIREPGRRNVGSQPLLRPPSGGRFYSLYKKSCSKPLAKRIRMIFPSWTNISLII